MIDLALFAGRLLLLALLYLFLFAAVRAGLGQVSAQRSKSAGAFTLTVTSGPPELKGVTLPLTGPVVIGRSPGADIVIGDDFVSGRHARIAPAGTDVVLEDLGSTNGTFVNRVRIREAFLKPGCMLTVGKTDIRFQSLDERV